MKYYIAKTVSGDFAAVVDRVIESVAGYRFTDTNRVGRENAFPGCMSACLSKQPTSIPCYSAGVA